MVRRVLTTFDTKTYANVAQRQSSGFVNQQKRHFEAKNEGLGVKLGVFSDG
jgi:hypothetical protein